MKRRNVKPFSPPNQRFEHVFSIDINEKIHQRRSEGRQRSVDSEETGIILSSDGRRKVSSAAKMFDVVALASAVRGRLVDHSIDIDEDSRRF